MAADTWESRVVKGEIFKYLTVEQSIATKNMQITSDRSRAYCKLILLCTIIFAKIVVHFTLFEFVFELPIPCVSKLWIYFYSNKDNMRLRTVLELYIKSKVVTKMESFYRNNKL